VNADERRQRLADIHQAGLDLFNLKVAAIAEAVAANDAAAIGEYLGYTRATIKVLALVDYLIPEHLRDPLTPIDVYRACIEAHGLACPDTGEPVTAAEWLERAIANGWRAHHIRAAADLADTRNKRQPWASTGADVVSVRGRRVLLELDSEPGRDVPERVKARLMPVLK
jgi:hypothetical protein